MSSLLLGLDVSPARAGWALVDLMTGELYACDVHALRGTQHTSRALRDEIRAAEKREGEVELIYMEFPMSRFASAAYQAGRAVGHIEAVCQRTWPHAPIESIKPPEWRVGVGLPGNAPKEDVLRWADSMSAGLVMGRQDVADAYAIALAGYRLNAEAFA